jgi:norsolorinic acid ketoreductase
MSAPYTVLISGGTRGIGKGFVERYLSRPNHVVIAANRDPSSATSKALSHLPTAAGSRLIVVKLDAAVEADAAAVIRSLVDAYGITHLDLVIANAGTGLVYPAVRAARRADLQTHIEINVFGPLHLLQAALPLLEKAAAPKWVTIGSSAASMGEMPPVPNAVYGSSKAMLNWLTRRLHFEEEWLTSFVIHPG